jgi:hypothetical protein
MADNQPDVPVKNLKQVTERVFKTPTPEEDVTLTQQKVIDLLEQRNRQRNAVFKVASWYCAASFLFLVAIIIVQIVGRAVTADHSFSIFSGNEMEFYITGVFGQFIGLLYVITKALYDDGNLKDLYNRFFDK